MDVVSYVLAIVAVILLLILLYCICYQLIKYYTFVNINENDYRNGF